MINLARKLADCDASFYGGWIMAGVNVQLKGNAVHFENKLLLNKGSKAVFEVTGTTAFGTETQKMRVFLVMPKQGDEAASADVDFPGKIVAKHVFTKEEIEAYVAYTGDENIVHKGERPLVPGLCMAYYLQQCFGLSQLEWRIAFKSPVYANDELVVYSKEGQLTAYVHDKVAFVIKF